MIDRCGCKHGLITSRICPGNRFSGRIPFPPSQRRLRPGSRAVLAFTARFARLPGATSRRHAPLRPPSPMASPWVPARPPFGTSSVWLFSEEGDSARACTRGRVCARAGFPGAAVLHKHSTAPQAGLGTSYPARSLELPGGAAATPSGHALPPGPRLSARIRYAVLHAHKDLISRMLRKSGGTTPRAWPGTGPWPVRTRPHSRR